MKQNASDIENNKGTGATQLLSMTKLGVGQIGPQGNSGEIKKDRWLDRRISRFIARI